MMWKMIFTFVAPPGVRDWVVGLAVAGALQQVALGPLGGGAVGVGRAGDAAQARAGRRRRRRHRGRRRGRRGRHGPG